MSDERPAWAQRIAAERTARSWSQLDAVKAMRAHASTELPADDSMVRQWKRWEAGTKPGDFYQPIIAAMFGTVTHAIFPRGTQGRQPRNLGGQRNGHAGNRQSTEQV
ncbi:hypothetical protein ABZS93_35090 [Streptomyces sp900116325]|uniref:hypothetical protein n=1 Tax=Streptomyces sp. 900116325 TaxID=3154295 RepID=UPI0033BF6696